MTTKETTQVLALNDVGLPRSISDRLMVMAYGAIQWPWLLRSLHGGRKMDKVALLDYLQLPIDALPNLGSWKADTHFLGHIVSAIELLKPQNVVELGCGASSLVISRALQLNTGGQLNAGGQLNTDGQLDKGGQLDSYDQHAEFAAATQQWITEHDLSGTGAAGTIHHAPLGPSPAGWPGFWYQLSNLPDSIDLLIIDGPPWAIHPHVRGAAASLFHRLRPGGMILLDDAARPGERAVARRWRREHSNIEFMLDLAGAKGTLIGRKLGPTNR